MGFMQGYPKALLYGAPQFMGHSFYHLHVIHIGLKIEHMMKHIRANTSKGQTACAMINWAQTQAGISTP
eukprot:9088110-Ditylum_brightwellii.AAC.1